MLTDRGKYDDDEEIIALAPPPFKI